MNSILIRKAILADCTTLAEFNSHLAFESEGIKLDPATILAGVTQVVTESSKGQYFVATAGDEVVGCTLITYEWSDWRNANMWWFQSVYVRADYRKRGVFRALHQFVVEAAKAASVSTLRLYVEEHNATAISTYQRLGMGSTPYRVMEQSLVGQKGD